MIWSSVLLIVAALALLVTGVLASSLELTYISIGVSILAAIALSIGVILRRDELFGTAGPARPGGPADWPAPDATSVAAMVAGRAGKGPASRDNGDLASAPRPVSPAGQAGPRRAEGRRDREEAAPGRRDRDREEAVPGRRDRDREEAAPGPRDRDRAAASWEDREAVPPPRPPAFRVPPFGDRPATPAPVQPGRGSQGPPARDERVSDEPPGDGRQDPGRPAWPATAGPRAMGTEPAAKQPPPEPRDGRPEPAWPPPSGFRLAEPAVPEHEPATESPERERDRGERPGAEPGAGRGLFEPFVTGKPRPAEGERAGDTRPAGAGEATEGPEPWPAEAGAGVAEDDDDRGAAEPGDVDEAVSADEVADLAAAAPSPPPPGGRDERRGKPGAEEVQEDGSAATPLDGEVTIVPGITRYHRRRCILIRFLSDGDLETMTRETAEAAGSVPCKACQPDKAVSD